MSLAARLGRKLAPAVRPERIEARPVAAELAKRAPPSAVAAPPATRGSCKAINADTGRQCALLAGHTSAHRHGRTEFWLVAEPGQTSFRKRDALDAAATARHFDPRTTTSEAP